MSDEGDLSDDIDLESCITFYDLAFFDNTCILSLKSSGGDEEITLRIDTLANHHFAIGEVVDYGEEPNGDISYDLRHARLFMQQFKLPHTMPVLKGGAMIGPIRRLDMTQTIKLIQSILNHQHDIELDVRTFFANCFPVAAAAPARHHGNVIQLAFGAPRP